MITAIGDNGRYVELGRLAGAIPAGAFPDYVLAKYRLRRCERRLAELSARVDAMTALVRRLG